MKGRRGRGTYSNPMVVGLFQRKGAVYTETVPDCSKATWQTIIRGRVDLARVIHPDGWRRYAGLVDWGYPKHLQVEHGKHKPANGTTHSNGIEGLGAW